MRGRLAKVRGTRLNQLDMVANLRVIPRGRLVLVEPEYQSLQQLPVGQVGTVLEVYGEDNAWYLVEFADLTGQDYAMATLQSNEVLALHYEVPLAS